MLYSGASLIRASGEQQEKITKLKLMPVSPVQSANPSESGLGEQTQHALLRLARFIKQEQGQKEGGQRAQPDAPVATPKTPHPYSQAFAAEKKHMNIGLFIDIYA